jgi:hypothetical protein
MIMAKGIQSWLEKFKNGWKKGEVDEVLALFTDDVEYWETPSEKLEPEELREEWNGVQQQEDIELDTEVFSSNGNKYTVQWELSYTECGEITELRGVYLIKLNSEGRCYEFWQYCQSE